MSEQKPGQIKFAEGADKINIEPSTITFHASAFKIGSDFICLDFAEELLFNHAKIKTIGFEYANSKKYTYKKVEET